MKLAIATDQFAFSNQLQVSTVHSTIFSRFFLRAALKDICNIKNSRLEHDLPTSVKGGVI